MATKIGGSNTSVNDDLAAFLALTTLEAQAVFLCEYAQAQQAVHNSDEANIANQIAKVGVAAGSASDGSVIGAGSISNVSLSATAATGLVWNGFEAFGFDTESPLVADAGDTITDPGLTTLLAIPTLPGQIAYVAAQLEALETAAKVLDPDLVTRVRLAVDFDLRLGGVDLAMPVGSGVVSSLVGSYV